MHKLLMWLQSLLVDPTSPLHLTGFVILYHEMLTGWTGGMTAIAAAGMCFGAGGAIDYAQAVQRKVL